MKKAILILFCCFLSLTSSFASSGKVSDLDRQRLKGADGAFSAAIDPNEDEATRERAINDIVRIYNTEPDYRRIIITVYNFKKKKFEEQNDLESKEKIMQIGYKLGFK